MTTRKRSTGQDIVQDAEHVLAKLALPRAQAALKLANKGRKKPLLTAADVKAQRANVAELKHRLGGQKTVAAKRKAATKTVVAARAELWSLLAEVRQAVLLTPGLDPQNAAAFLRGRKINANGTSSLLDATTAILDAAAGTMGSQAVRDAGITPAKIKQLAAARDALDAADTASSGATGTRREATAETRAARSAVRKQTAQFRKVMAFVLRDQPALLKQFAATLPRYTPKKRAAQTPKSAS